MQVGVLFFKVNIGFLLLLRNLIVNAGAQGAELITCSSFYVPWSHAFSPSFTPARWFNKKPLFIGILYSQKTLRKKI